MIIFLYKKILGPKQRTKRTNAKKREKRLRLAAEGIVTKNDEKSTRRLILSMRHRFRANVQKMDLDTEGDLGDHLPTLQLKGRSITWEEIVQTFGAIDGITYVPSQEK